MLLRTQKGFHTWRKVSLILSNNWSTPFWPEILLEWLLLSGSWVIASGLNFSFLETIHLSFKWLHQWLRVTPLRFNPQSNPNGDWPWGLMWPNLWFLDIPQRHLWSIPNGLAWFGVDQGCQCIQLLTESKAQSSGADQTSRSEEGTHNSVFHFQDVP